jgi:pimeloyl-ACP methyl ester carboxylesterase
VDTLGLLTLLLAGLVTGLLALSLYTLRILTRPPRRTYASALARNRPGEPNELPQPLPYTHWTLNSRGLALPVWDLAGLDPSGPVIILTHGWGDSRIGGLTRVPALAPHASRLVLWDLPGHGEAPGSCRLGATEHLHLLDLWAAVAPPDAPAPPVVLFGWSLGAGLSIAAAARRSPAAVIAEAPYRLPITPARNMLRALALPWRANLPPALAAVGAMSGVGPRWRHFDRATLAAILTCPLLVIHGEHDDICPLADGRAIADAAPSASLAVISGAGHYSLWTDPAHAPSAAHALAAFFQALREQPAQPLPSP